MSRSGPWTILFVEDNSLLASSLKTFLENNAPLRVELEERGDTAVTRILQEQPDLVLLDIGLPGLDGFEVCERVRSSYHGPIMVLTANPDDEKQLKGLGLGVDDYLIKPVPVTIILARINSLLRRTQGWRPEAPEGASDPAGQGEQTFVVGELVIQPHGRLATLRGRKLELQASEFDLLWLLARHLGLPVGRERIHETVCGRPWNGRERAVDQIVGRLRRKLEQGPGMRRYLRTVRGVGYLLAPQEPPPREGLGDQ